MKKTTTKYDYFRTTCFIIVALFVLFVCYHQIIAVVGYKIKIFETNIVWLHFQKVFQLFPFIIICFDFKSSMMLESFNGYA